jgi:acyl-CoA reductase-like NAD-dependent aldehyde dehydrogenase
MPSRRPNPRGAEGVLLAVPEYAIGMPGAFENALDGTLGGQLPLPQAGRFPRSCGTRAPWAHVRSALELLLHALVAAGDPVVLRPASQTPISALTLGRIVLEAGWPEDAIAVVPSSTADATALVEDERLKLLTFTGSAAVGWSLKSRAGRKRVALELGGNAPVIVDARVDVPYAASRIAWGATVQSGQSCISVQRVYVHAEVWDELVPELVDRMRELKTGDPLREETDVGPLIDSHAAERVEEWVAEARERGARILTGGQREGRVWQPTVLVDAPEDLRIVCEEAFAPLLAVFRCDEIDDGIARAGASEFGLQAGLFTNDLAVVEMAFDQIDVGGLIVNDVPTFRVDHMPYGGVRQSGSVGKGSAMRSRR